MQPSPRRGAPVVPRPPHSASLWRVGMYRCLAFWRLGEKFWLKKAQSFASSEKMTTFAAQSVRTITKQKIREDEKNVPASQQEESEQARFPREDVNEERPPRAGFAPRQGPQEAHRFRRASRKVNSAQPLPGLRPESSRSGAGARLCSTSAFALCRVSRVCTPYPPLS